MSAAQSQVWTIPNLLSAARLGLAIVLFVVIGRQDFATAALLFLIAASTDWIDGWWARHFQQVSRLGRIFDPLVDKVIVCGSFILLAALVDPVIAPWMAVVVVVWIYIDRALGGLSKSGCRNRVNCGPASHACRSA